MFSKTLMFEKILSIFSYFNPFVKMVYFIGIFAYFISTIGSAPDTLLTTSVSPNGEYHLEAYLINPHATVDFSIRVYIVDDGDKDKDKELIYDEYSESEVEIEWISDSEVVINEITLDLDKNETYDSYRDYYLYNN